MTEKAIEKGEAILHTHDSVVQVRTSFFDQKIRTLFARFDFDGNGKIEKDDFETWTNNLAISGNLNNERKAHLHQNIISIWDAYFLPADTNHDGSVEYLELLDHMKAALRGDRDDPVKRKAIFDTLPLIFDAIDTNSDGDIASEEFQAYFASFGLKDPKFAIEIFKEMDTNHDLALSKQEFVDAGIDFFMGLDNTSPSRFFFGPLHK